MGMSIEKGLRKGTSDEIQDKFNEYLDIFGTSNYQKKLSP